ncbi:MAG: hypothetical protein UHN47_16015 [Lachnospiraceae bacterium]|nr:hypothetical protein [Lachnospiraceae bacterium]
MRTVDLEDNYIEFAHAVIKQLVRDYRKSYRYMLKYPDVEAPKKRVEGMEEFVHSYFFGLVVTMEPKKFIKLMRESI